MLLEMRELGFDFIELSHGIRLSLLPGIMEAVSAGEVRISSVHNFCPLPVGVTRPAPNLFQFSSTSARERDRAVRYTLKTIEFAAQVGAPFVVLHLGTVEMKDYSARLKTLLARGLRVTPRYQKVCSRALRALAGRKKTPSGNAIAALRELATEASRRGVKLGVENREGLEEIPVDGDIHDLMREIGSPCVGYWHDTGHAQIKDNLGLIHHRLHLDSLAAHLFGFHIHDVQFPARDHCAPGGGMIDFHGLSAWVKPDHVKVFELSPRLSRADVLAGVVHVKRCWGPG